MKTLARECVSIADLVTMETHFVLFTAFTYCILQRLQSSYYDSEDISYSDTPRLIFLRYHIISKFVVYFLKNAPKS